MHHAPFVTLQSGFVTRAHGDLYRYVAPVSSFAQTVLNKTMMGLVPEGYYSKSVTDLVDEYEKNRQALNDFGYRERVLLAAIRMFDGTTLPEWLKKQRDTDYFSDLHKTFVIETLNFITGSPRLIQTVQWMSLLDAGKSNMKTYIDYAEFFDDSHQPMPLPRDTLDLLRLWVSRDGGYEDLLLTLWCLFGKRQIQHDVHLPNKQSPGEIPFGMIFGGDST